MFEKITKHLGFLGSIAISWSCMIATPQFCYGSADKPDCYCGWFEDDRVHCQPTYDGVTNNNPTSETLCDSLCWLRNNKKQSQHHFWSRYGDPKEQCHTWAKTDYPNATLVDDQPNVGKQKKTK